MPNWLIIVSLAAIGIVPNWLIIVSLAAIGILLVVRIKTGGG